MIPARSVLRKAVAPLVVVMLASLATPGRAQSDALPRRGFFGAQVESVPESLTTKLGLPSGRGVLVKALAADGAARVAGVAARDVILSVDGVDVNDPRAFVALVREHRAGDQFRVTLLRDGKRLRKVIAVKPLPLESDPSFDVLYRSVVVDGGRLRTIVTKPKAPGRHPAVLLIGGLGCYSLDGIGEGHAYGKILYALTRQGYVTMRVEKRGMGDSEGAPCSSPQTDLRAEVGGFVAGLEALKSYDFVEASSVVVFGHSMGGIVAPLVVNRSPASGVIVAGTIGTSIVEHELANLRRQLVLRGADYADVDAIVRQKEACNHRLYVERQTPEQIAKDAPGCTKLPIQPAAPYTYMQQAAALSLAKEWQGVEVPVLVVYGGADYRTSVDEHQYLANMINSRCPGRATFVQIAEMDHGFAQASSQRASLQRTSDSNAQEVFQPRFLDEVQRWLKSLPREPLAPSTGATGCRSAAGRSAVGAGPLRD
jgi:alpha-beta hydrolase superfamily lysophospholipase